jgi:hypothetical protein
MEWVRISAGRETRISPRDIIGILEDSLGLPMRTVGIIDIMPGQSFAQVPQQYLDLLRNETRTIETNAGPIEISLQSNSAEGKTDRGSSKKKFSKKPHQ